MEDEEATVVATYSRRMQIELGNGSRTAARIKGKTLKPVCGDRVQVSRIENESDWLITGVSARRNVLSRPNMRGDVEFLAANVDLLAVVAAASPEPDWFIVDRYLCAAEDMDCRSVVVFNKTDMSAPPAEIDEYAAIGYDTISCSATTGENLEQLRTALDHDTAIMVGQSGVGKSSLINGLLGAEALRTASVSDKNSEGRHTTVNSEMLEIPGGARVIDSPGVRDYAPAIADASVVAHGFKEIVKASESCRFANCRHLREPRCAVKTAVDAGEISARRYESYRRLHTLTSRLAEQRQ